MSSRRRRRSSTRALVAVLVLTAGTGTTIAYRKYRNSNAAPTPLLATDQQPTGDKPAPITVLPPPEPPKPAAKEIKATPLLASTQTPAPTLAEKPQPPKPTTEPTAAPVAEATRPTSSPVTLTNNPIGDGRAKMDSGDLIGARSILAAALASNALTATDAAAAREILGQVNDQLVFARKVYKDDDRTLSIAVPPGGVLAKIAAEHSVTWELLCRINGIADPRRVKAGQTLKVVKGPFHAVVSKSRFQLDLYLGDPNEPGSMYVRSFNVGLGKDDSTPLGTWRVEPNKKIKNPTYFSPRGEGVMAADDPRNPLGEYWLGLTGIDGQAVGKMSYGIHGTIEPDTIGKMESMGCIRLVNEDVAQVFELLVEGKSLVYVRE